MAYIIQNVFSRKVLYDNQCHVGIKDCNIISDRDLWTYSKCYGGYVIKNVATNYILCIIPFLDGSVQLGLKHDGKYPQTEHTMQIEEFAPDQFLLHNKNYKIFSQLKEKHSKFGIIPMESKIYKDQLWSFVPFHYEDSNRNINFNDFEKNWKIEHGYKRNNEDQYYNDKNFKIVDNSLYITAKHQSNIDYQIPQPTDFECYNDGGWTSSSLVSKWKFRYGRLTIEAKFKPRQGMWPAIWTTGSGKQWPHCGEIDIFEYYRNIVHANLCWAKDPQNLKNYKQEWRFSTTKYDQILNNDDVYHKWTLIWTENYIEIWLDDWLLLQETNLQDTPFGKDCNTQNLRLNVAVGGRAGGDPGDNYDDYTFSIRNINLYQNSSFGKCIYTR